MKAVVALLVGGGLALALIWAVGDDGDASSSKASGAATSPAHELVRRWEQWRRAEAVMAETTVRIAGDLSTNEEVIIAQQWPDRVVTSGRTVSARLGARSIGCSPGTDDVVRCTDSGGFDPERELELELGELRGAVLGSGADYSVVSTTAGCVRVRLIGSNFRPLLGQKAVYCFDDASKVLRSERVVKDGVTITVTREVRSTMVRPGDLALPAAVVGG